MGILYSYCFNICYLLNVTLTCSEYLQNFPDLLLFVRLPTVNHENKHCRIEVAPLQISYWSTRYTRDPLTDYIAPKNVSNLVVTNDIYDFCGCDKTTSEYQQRTFPLIQNQKLKCDSRQKPIGTRKVTPVYREKK